jgi:class 3 adenylate cyclase
LVRALIWAHHGYETHTAGDAFMVVFGNAADAVEFAMVLQLARASRVVGCTRYNPSIQLRGRIRTQLSGRL